MRTIWAGTRCVLVTRCSSMSSSTPAASKRCWNTTVAPSSNGNMPYTHCAEWYAGPHTSCTGASPGTSIISPKLAAMSCHSSTGPPVVASPPRTPLGKPVVPDV